MNLPNSLTLMRVLLIPVFMVLMLSRFSGADWWAAAIFALAAVTDTLDGMLARKYDQITDLGIIMDPLADKLMVCAALVSLVQIGTIPGWMVVVILGREFAIMGLRVVRSQQGEIISASKLGKTKTEIQVFAIILAILDRSIFNLIHVHLGYWTMMVAVIITLWSGVDYFYKAYHPNCNNGV